MGDRDDQFHPEPCPPAVGPTLRDRFAMAALQGDLAATRGEGVGLSATENQRKFAAWCYEMADAMLLARTPPEAPNDR